MKEKEWTNEIINDRRSWFPISNTPLLVNLVYCNLTVYASTRVKKSLSLHKNQKRQGHLISNNNRLVLTLSVLRNRIRSKYYTRLTIHEKRPSNQESNLRANGRLTSTLGAYFFCFLIRYFSCKQNVFSFGVKNGLTSHRISHVQVPVKMQFSCQMLHYLR